MSAKVCKICGKKSQATKNWFSVFVSLKYSQNRAVNAVHLSQESVYDVCPNCIATAHFDVKIEAI